MENKTDLFNPNKTKEPHSSIMNTNVKSDITTNESRAYWNRYSGVKPFDIVIAEDGHVGMAIFNLNTNKQIGWLNCAFEQGFQFNSKLNIEKVKARSYSKRWDRIVKSTKALLTSELLSSREIKNLISNIIITQILECVYLANYETGEYLYTEIYNNNNKDLLQRVSTMAKYSLRLSKCIRRKSDFYFKHLLDLESIFRAGILNEKSAYIAIMNKHSNENFELALDRQLRLIHNKINVEYDVSKYIYLDFGKVYWYIFWDLHEDIILRFKIFSEADIQHHITNYLMTNKDLDLSSINACENNSIIQNVLEQTLKNAKSSKTLVYSITKSKLLKFLSTEHLSKLTSVNIFKDLLLLVSNGLMCELELKLRKELDIESNYLNFYIDKVN